MGKVIRIKARQSMVNYRKPASFVIRETYPLPPYSTVIGMVHNVCGFTEYHPMKVSVQGRSRGITSDLFTCYSFANDGYNRKYDKERHQIKVPDGDENLGVVRGISHTELLCNVELILHLEPVADDFDTIMAGLNRPMVYPALGRHEDLLDIEEITEVEVRQDETVTTLRDIYIPISLLSKTDNAEGIEGTVYQLPKEYVIENGFRRWKEPVKTRYVGAENRLYDFWVDGDQNPVALI